jgi:hypothetical protein
MLLNLAARGKVAPRYIKVPSKMEPHWLARNEEKTSGVVWC